MPFDRVTDISSGSEWEGTEVGAGISQGFSSLVFESSMLAW
jgi:hypothetical protein